MNAPLKRLATIKARVGWKGLTSNEFEIRSHAYLVTGRDFRRRYIDWKTCYQVSEERYDDDPFIQLRNGDLLVTKDGTIGKVALVDGLDKPACLNSGVFVVRPQDDLETLYLYWILQSEVFSDFISEVSRGSTIQHLYQEEFRELRIPLREIEEQRTIADYLDRETAQIDAFIAKNEELITLLTERRAAVISHAVTRGVVASAPLTASGVEWLGDIPSHWSVQRLASTVARAGNGVWGSDADGGGKDIRCVRVADFDRPKQLIHDDAHTLRKVSASERAGRVLRNGDLLLEKSGGGEKSPVGFVVLYDRHEPAVCSNFVARVELRAGMDPKFWAYVHGAMYRLRITEKSLKQSTGIQNLDQSAYFNEYVAVPPYREQCAIAEQVEQRTAEIDAAVSTARDSAALARERRAALISAAVTGKIDAGVAV